MSCKKINEILTKNIKDIYILPIILLGVTIISLSGISSYALFSNTSNSSGIVSGTVVKPVTSGTETIIGKVGTGGLVAEEHPATDQLQATIAYRYTGAKPDNYVSFNNELWRIIGVFETDDGTGSLQPRIKLIRNDSIGNVIWNTTDNKNSINDWSIATGKDLLNAGDYWNRTGAYSLTGLTNEAKQMIDNAVWYLGGTPSFETQYSGLASHFYSYERGTSVYTGDGETRPTLWTGKVGLMYPSDYGYATSGLSSNDRDYCISRPIRDWASIDDCYLNDWIYNSSLNDWTITPYNNYNSAFYIPGIEFMGVCGYISYNGVLYESAFRPCIYLKSNILITGGSGTSTDPYQLSL